ncbi:MAG: 50S ribosomal protein L17 [Chitinivibrionales bacterium]|nr:50S ribosomal protein L17 [Chitinivibrionales bacterium]
MRHRQKGRTLDRSPSHRRALKANLAASLFEKERIVTTLAKAKEVRGTVERLISYGKKGGLNMIRKAATIIRDKTILKKLFSDIAPSYKDREGGYTRIVKMHQRKGDASLLAILELVGRGSAAATVRRKKKKGATPAKKGAAAPAQNAEPKAAGSAAPEAAATAPTPEEKPEGNK